MDRGDATKETIGAIDWGRATRAAAKEPLAYTAVEARALLEQLEGAPACPNSEDGRVISAVELLALAAPAAARGSLWANELAFYATGNQNVKTWLTKRRPEVGMRGT